MQCLYLTEQMFTITPSPFLRLSCFLALPSLVCLPLSAALHSTLSFFPRGFIIIRDKDRKSVMKYQLSCVPDSLSSPPSPSLPPPAPSPSPIHTDIHQRAASGLCSQGSFPRPPTSCPSAVEIDKVGAQHTFQGYCFLPRIPGLCLAVWEC